MFVEKDFEHAGLRCVIVETDMGHLCGYVGVPKSHLLHGVQYHENYKKDTTPEDTIDVYGGITYSGEGKYPVSSNDLWWFGYDCNHYQDITNPKSVGFCIAECQKMADQLAALGEVEQ